MRRGDASIFAITCRLRCRVRGHHIGLARRAATQFGFKLSWLKETQRKAERMQSAMQIKPLVEMAATALALILTHCVVNIGPLDVTNYGDRADYRALEVDCVLEISGTELPSELAR